MQRSRIALLERRLADKYSPTSRCSAAVMSTYARACVQSAGYDDVDTYPRILTNSSMLWLVSISSEHANCDSLISSLLPSPLLRLRARGTRAAFGANAPCAPAMSDPRFRHTQPPVCPALSSCRHSAAYLHLDAMSVLSSGVSFHHSDAVVHAALVVIFTSVICTSAGVAGTERFGLGQQMRFLTAT